MVLGILAWVKKTQQWLAFTCSEHRAKKSSSNSSTEKCFAVSLTNQSLWVVFASNLQVINHKKNETYSEKAENPLRMDLLGQVWERREYKFRLFVYNR